MSVLFPEIIVAVDYSFVQNQMTITRVAGTPYNILTDIQPITTQEGGQLFESLPNSRKDVGHIKVYSNTELSISEEGTTGSGTVLTWSGRKWEIIQEMEYQKNSFFTLVDHYKYIGELRTEEELTSVN